ncbi:FeS assembly SUF system protein [Candidatus Uhrbacteria bacterium CG10_big_fil_rev_8_21_14_0_10_48_11]|uniref:FeS assembly SUF system protein n=1 Tax=Candidatus Uhrbacteria bacterium CG10_big_fil_rev_8_21_14_0_10_48_11 TaxID=1975037 RepID=A0A2M8LFF6_9BACT|nr:MAG: FeS assembly SUF system protein [Candidatus Uhrbacteria bacterium CG10_big_fil_rev_8_21_14_0_10_48_11]
MLSWRALEALLAEPTTTVVQKKLALEERIIAALKTVFDPEVPVNIYDLGFIYKLTVTEDGKVTILMTLTTPHCPVAESLPREVERRIATVDGVSTVSVALTFTPPWTKEKMSNDARLALGI